MGFWRCSVVSPYVANFEEEAQPHLRPIGAPERDVSFYFQGGANNRGTYGYAFRQAALAQLDGLSGAHVSAFSLPGSPAPCRAGVSTNCRAGRSNPVFRSLMRRARFNLVLRGDSPSSRRLVDGIAAGALSVLVSDELWTVGLPFGCLVPWRRMAFTMAERQFETESGAADALRQLDRMSLSHLQRMQRVANRHRRDLIWNLNESRVAENLLLTAALRCLPSHVTRRAAARTSELAHSIRQLRQQCPHGDRSLTCRVPDGTNCVGCETGDLAAWTPLEHCCGDSCPQCNRTPSRCVPPSIYYGDPLTQGPQRRAALLEYLGKRDKMVPAEMQRWRAMAGKPKAAAGRGGGTSRPSGHGALLARGGGAAVPTAKARGAPKLMPKTAPRERRGATPRLAQHGQ